MDSFFLTGRWLLEGDTLAERTDHALIVRDQRIVWIGPAKEASPPDGAIHLDLGEATLLPGLIDAHMHTFGMNSQKVGDMDIEREPYRALRAAGELRELLLAGFTSARCLGSSVGPDLARAIAEGHVPGPRLIAAGAFISTTGGTWDSPPLPASFPRRAESLADGADELRRIVRLRARQGADFIKLGLSKGYPTDRNQAWGDDPFAQVVAMTLEEVRAATDEAHRHGMKVSAHAIGEDAVALALDSGIDVIEHGYAISEATRKRIVSAGIPVVTTLSQLHFHRMAYEPFGYPQADRDVYDRHWDAMRRDFETGHAAGVRFVLGTDLIGKPTHPLGQAAAEFQFAVELGMTEAEALKAGTVLAAEVLGVAATTGRLSPGWTADITAFPGRVLADIGLLARPSLVMRSGQIWKEPTGDCASQ